MTKSLGLNLSGLTLKLSYQKYPLGYLDLCTGSSVGQTDLGFLNDTLNRICNIQTNSSPSWYGLTRAIKRAFSSFSFNVKVKSGIWCCVVFDKQRSFGTATGVKIIVNFHVQYYLHTMG